MKKIISITFLVLMLVGILSSSAFAEGKVTVVEKNLIEYDADDNAYFFAKVVNDGDEEVIVDNGKLVGFSANDDILVSQSYVSSCPSNIKLAPGESAYVREFIWDGVLEDQDVVDYKFSIGTGTYGYDYNPIPCESRFELNGSLDNYIYVTVTNDSNEIWYNTYIAVALYDSNNNLIYVDSNYYTALGIHPNSTVTLKFYVDSDMMDYYQMHGISIARSDALAYVYVG